MDINSHVGIIEMMSDTHIPESFIPYDILLMLAVIFALANWLASRSLKRLRHREYELETEIIECERRIERDRRRIEELQQHIGEMYGDVEDEVSDSS